MVQMTDRIISQLSWWLAALAGLALLAIAGILMLDVTLRAVASPLRGALEIVRVLFVIACFLAFAYTALIGREIRIEGIRALLPWRLAAACDLMAALLSLAFFGFLIWFASIRWWQAWTRDIFLEGRLYIPMTIPWGVIAVGSALAVIVALRSAVIAGAGIVRRQEQQRTETF